MAEQVTFPQSGDKNDAEHFASLVGAPNLADYVVTGLTFTTDFGVPETTVSTGKAFIMTTSETASSSSDTILRTNHVVQVPQQTVSLTDSNTNYLYLEPNFGTDDNASVTAYTSSQSGDRLLLGTIDTSADTEELRNRNPAGRFKELKLPDDDQLLFGDDDDYVVEYDSTNDILSVDDSAGNDLIDIRDSETDFYNTVDLNSNTLNNVSDITNSTDIIGSDELVNDSVTVAGNAVSLGSSTTVAHGDLSDAPADAHHTKYTDAEAKTASETGTFSPDALQLPSSFTT